MTVQGKRFKKKLIDKDMTQKEVAEHFGWTPQYLRQLIMGMTAGPAADENLQKVKEYLGL